MGRVYRNKKQIPIPEWAHINHSDGRVFIYASGSVPVRESGRIVIGHAATETTMFPNDTFRHMYPNLWEEYYGESEQLPYKLRSGMYALTLGIGYITGLYMDLQEAYGPQFANFLMDFSMYSIKERSNVAMDFQETMQESVLFSERAWNDAWISDSFTNKMTESMNQSFRSLWLDRCRKSGISEAWLCIDGSNNDCDARECELAEPGHAKSKRSGNIVSYMYAVTEDGMPLTYTASYGGMVDSVAFQEIAEILSNSAIAVKGIIVDRGFCTQAVLDKLEESGYSYVMMLTSNVYGYTKMFEDYAEKIRWNVEYAVNEEGCFGISDRKQIFADHPKEACISLFFDGRNGPERSVHLMKKIMRAKTALENTIRDGKTPTVSSDLKKYLRVEKEGETWKVACDYKEWQAAMDSKGFCAIAASMDLTAEQMDYIYHLRDASEKQYSILKTQLGYDVTRSHATAAIRNRYAACFIASIIRSEIVRACKELDLETSRMIRKVDRIELTQFNNSFYIAIHNESSPAKDLLRKFDILPGDFDVIATDVNTRKTSPVVSGVREKPAHEGNNVKRKRGRPPKSDKSGKKTAETLSSKAQSPNEKNSKAGATLKSEAEKSQDSDVAIFEETVHRGPGRPKGSKNKKTAQEKAAEKKEEVHRGPGRPKGSKNKNKKLKELEMQNRPGRGRPKGAKDKKPRTRTVFRKDEGGKEQAETQS